MFQKKKATFILLLIALLFDLSGDLVFAQNKAEPKKKQYEPGELMLSYRVGTHKKVLDLLMPIPKQGKPGVETTLTVRVLPTFDPEMQYVFIKRKTGPVEVTKWWTAENIQYKMYDILEESPELEDEDDQAAKFAARLKAKKCKTRISRVEFDELVKELVEAIQRNETIPDHGALHGTTYKFELSGTIHRQFSRGDDRSLKGPPDETDNPLTTWIRKMQKNVGL